LIHVLWRIDWYSSYCIVLRIWHGRGVSIRHSLRLLRRKWLLWHSTTWWHVSRLPCWKTTAEMSTITTTWWDAWWNAWWDAWWHLCRLLVHLSKVYWLRLWNVLGRWSIRSNYSFRWWNVLTKAISMKGLA